MNSARLALAALLAGALIVGSTTSPAAAQATEPAPPLPTAVATPAVPAPAAPSPAGPTAPAAEAPQAPEPSAEPVSPAAPAQATQLPEAPAKEHPEEAGAEAGESAEADPHAQEESSAGDSAGDFDPVGEGHVVPGPAAPLVTHPDGSVHSPVDTDHDHGSAAAAGAELRSFSAAAGAQRAGTIKVTLVMTSLKDKPWRNTEERKAAERAAHRSLETADAYWRAMSHGRLGLSTVNVKYVSSSATQWDDYAAVMNQVSREVGWKESPYTALVAYTTAADLKVGGYGGFLGGGWPNAAETGGRVLMPAPSQFSNNVLTHEFGHTLGLLHANSLQCTNGRSDVGFTAGRWSDGACSSREYADTLDLMGYAQYDLPTINSYFWDIGGFGSGREVRDLGTVTTPRSATLKPWGGTAAERAVKFTDPVSGEVYYLELRQPAGYDAYLAGSSAGNRGVKITKADRVNTWSAFSVGIQPSTKPFAGYYGDKQAWQQGQTFTTHTGTTVKIDANSPTGASVTITPKDVTASLFYRTSPVQSTAYGNVSDVFLTCDWNGDGVSTAAAFRNGQWHFRETLTGWTTARIAYFGNPGDQPICGDWDGDGRESMGVYRNGLVYLRNSTTTGPADGAFAFGSPGDTAIVGDWDGDGNDTLGVARDDGSGKRFFLTNSNIRPATHGSFHYGMAGDIPVAGDWNNDRIDSVGVKRGLTWYLADSNIVPRATRTFQFGNPQDLPLTGTWRRGGPTEVGVVR